MHFKSTSRSTIFDNSTAKGFQLAETPLNDFVKLEIEPAGIIAVHKLPIAVTFYIIKGEGFLYINGDKILAKQGDVLFIENDAERSWENMSDSKLEVLVVKQKE